MELIFEFIAGLKSDTESIVRGRISGGQPAEQFATVVDQGGRRGRRASEGRERAGRHGMRL